MLPKATGLRLALDWRSILLTGKNGIGKSTPLRCVGLNVLTAGAGAFGFCCTRSICSAPGSCSKRAARSAKGWC